MLTILTRLQPQGHNKAQTMVNCQNQSFNKTSKTALTKLVDSQGTSTKSNSLTTLIQLSTHHEQYQSTSYPSTKQELDEMIPNEIITEVTAPTEWVNSLVWNVSKTKDGIDPKDLNKNIRRQHYYTRTIDEILPRMHGKKYLSVADTNKGYWHVELDEESSLLCTFNTPFGRYRFKRLPFDQASMGEHT